MLFIASVLERKKMSIKICVISPISHLEDFSHLGEIDMSLSHLVLENGGCNDYSRYYQKQSEKGRYVILDNSAFELEQRGKGLDPNLVLDAAEVICPSEVIATDVLFEGAATVWSTKNFIKAMKARNLIGKYKVMAVVQGKTEEEWFDCLIQLLWIPEVDVIGFSKLSIPMSFLGERESSGNCAQARLKCTEKIQSRIDDLIKKESCYGALFSPLTRLYRECDNGGVVQVHLLGGDNWTAWEMKQQSRYPWIRSNDSSCAVWYGADLQEFDDEGKINDIILEKPDLENENERTKGRLEVARGYILSNICHWHMACKGDPNVR